MPSNANTSAWASSTPSSLPNLNGTQPQSFGEENSVIPDLKNHPIHSTHLNHYNKIPTAILKLYGSPKATCMRRVTIILHELIEVDVMNGQHKSAALMEKQPFGQIPFYTYPMTSEHRMFGHPTDQAEADKHLAVLEKLGGYEVILGKQRYVGETLILPDLFHIPYTGTQSRPRPRARFSLKVQDGSNMLGWEQPYVRRSRICRDIQRQTCCKIETYTVSCLSEEGSQSESRSWHKLIRSNLYY
ncbi:hypothetical protein C8R43DRAFT_962370 [Mycena crocata]|nr:hypothetical protein C8R43DRAFT_962370 [Mycena crocata]